MNLSRWDLRACVRILAAALLLAMPFPARAILGDSAASVLTDQARMKGTLRSVDRGIYVLHEITTTTGAVREFVSPAGRFSASHGKANSLPTSSSCLALTTNRSSKRPRSRPANNRPAGAAVRS